VNNIDCDIYLGKNHYKMAQAGRKSRIKLLFED